MSELRAAVIGVGYLGRIHAMKYRAVPGIDLVGVVDIQHERARQVAQEVETDFFEDHRELFGRIDVATVAVPTVAHHVVAKDLLQQGIHVLVEKPITAHVEEARELVRLAERHGVILQVGHLERFNPAVEAVKKHLKDPLFMEVHRISPFPSRGADVDVVLDLMIHDIDLILDFAGVDLLQVDAVGVPILTSTYDIVNARFKFASGCVANVTASRISAKSLRKIRVFQRDAYLSADCGKGEALVYRRLSPSKKGGIPNIVAQQLSVEEKDPLLEEVRSFVEAVRHRRPPVIDGATGIRCLEVARRVLDEIERHVPEEFRQNLWD